MALTVTLLKHDCKLLEKDSVLCGVPYGGIPIATALSMMCNYPQILVRKDVKKYGMKKQIEGIHTKNIVLIEDVITTGSSVIETCNILKNNGYSIKGIVSIVYRGEKQIIKNVSDIPYNYLFHINEINYFKQHLSAPREFPLLGDNMTNGLQQKLRDCKYRKQSNIILAFDKSYPGAVYDLYKLLDVIHPHIVGVKVHNEILKLNYNENMKLYKKCKELDVFLWEDRKFNDIGNTVNEQIKYYESIRDYISIVPIGGSLSIPVKTNLGIFLLSELSCKNNFINTLNTQNIISLTKYQNICAVICQHPEYVAKNFPTIMPGIHLNKTTDGLNQQWRDPTKLQHKPTFYVIGRAITNSENPESEILIYKNILFIRKII